MTVCSSHTYDTLPFAGTLTNVDSDTILSTEQTAGRFILIVYLRIVQGASTGAVITASVNATPILQPDPVNYEAVLENYPLASGDELTIETTGTGTADYTGSYRVL